MKLLITTDVINNNEDLEYLIPLMLTAISYTDINDSLFNYNALKADILDALIDDRMSDYYTESSIDETLSYILSFMRQKEKEHQEVKGMLSRKDKFKEFETEFEQIPRYRY